ncbi:MAG: peptidoglycan-binding protein [Methylovulum sp.]|nr:peptidoglycan-binding protein [Methylovulum sp.]
MSLTDRVPVPTSINPGVKNAKQQTMLDILGKPRSSFTQDCQEVTNPDLKALIVTDDVGPFRVTGLKPAVVDLREIFANVKSANPALYAALSTAGMLCARLVRNTTRGSISNHAWGTAIDIKINKELDRYGDGKVQAGLVLLAPFFNQHGWFWGAGFGTEDGMHFEAGDGRVREWHVGGLHHVTGGVTPDEVLRLGDRGPEVCQLQERLNAAGANLVVDGDFGQNTHDAVLAFQQQKGLKADGVVGSKTSAALGL